MHYFLKVSGDKFSEKTFLEGFERWIKEIKAGCAFSKTPIDFKVFCEGKLCHEKMLLLNHFR